VPKVVKLQVTKHYADKASSITEYHEYEGRGYPLTLDDGWKDVAEDVLAWLAKKELLPAGVSTAGSAA
jgi:esterase/lipase